MSDASNIKEISKAVAEASKFGTKSVETTEKILGFLAKVFEDTIEQVSGIVSDKLKFLRWQRQIRIVDQVEKILKQRKIKITRSIPPKFALPMLENASLEEDDQLQDIWIRLMANSMDPNFDAKFRMAYIEMIKGLAPLDVRILDFFYKSLVKDGMAGINFTAHSYTQGRICNSLNINKEEYLDSIYNLFRVQCLAPAIITGDAMMGGEPLTIFKGADEISMTPLGKNFIEACIKKD